MADTRLITGSGKLVWQETVELPDDGVHGPLLVRLRRGRGEGDALPALFMHSIGLSGRSWLPVIGNLSNVGEWVSVDLPGFGESGKPKTASYQLSWQAARMQDLLDHLGWDEAVLVGNSMGGGIVALYYTVFSGRIAADALLAKAGAYGAVEHFYLFAAFLCIGNSGMEEYYWRWFVYRGLRNFMPVKLAVVVSALGFTLHHVVVLSAYFPSVGFVVLLNVGVFVGGCVWALLYEKHRSIVGPWVSHCIVDAAIMVVAYDLLFRG